MTSEFLADILGEDGLMAASATPELSIGHKVPDVPSVIADAKRRRISPEAGRALEILGHAIEYLIDQYAHDGGNFSADDPQVQAVLMLMAVNRQVYFDCPEVQSFRQRLSSILNRYF